MAKGHRGLWVLILGVGVTSGCRSARKGMRVGGDTAELSLTMTGLSAEDQKNPNFIYELSGCVSPLNGLLSETSSSIVSFKSPLLRPTLKSCEFRIRLAQTPPDVRPVDGAEPGVLYLAKDLRLTTNSDGSLVTSAPLQKMFDRVAGDTRSSFTLKIKVKLPEPPGNVITGALQCSPSIVGVGSYEGAESGELRFVIGVANTQTYQCTKLFINADGKLQMFAADLPSNTSFQASSGGEQTLGPFTMIKQSVASSAASDTSSDLEVNTTGIERCRDGEVFDTTSFTCKTP